MPANENLTIEDRIFVVIPSYRVEAFILDVIRGIPPWVDGIVVVDDGSPDLSAEKVIALGDDRVTLIRHSTNQGLGAAMMSGFNKAIEKGATILVKMDGDGQMSPDYLPDVLAPILEGRADYVKGNRFMHTRAIQHMPALRRIGNVGLSFLMKLTSGYWNVFDPTNGFVALDADVYREVDQSNIHRRYYFESSLLVELNLQRAVIVEVGMPAKYGAENSSLSILWVLMEFPLLMLKGFLRRLWLQYFVLDFSVGSLFMTVGLLFSVFGAVWGALWWRNSILTGVVASTGTVMVAALPLILGFQLLLQAIVFDVQNIPRRPRSRFATLRSRGLNGKLCKKGNEEP